jgi:hypothetical protein
MVLRQWISAKATHASNGRALGKAHASIIQPRGQRTPHTTHESLPRKELAGGSEPRATHSANGSALRTAPLKRSARQTEHKSIVERVERTQSQMVAPQVRACTGNDQAPKVALSAEWFSTADSAQFNGLAPLKNSFRRKILTRVIQM